MGKIIISDTSCLIALGNVDELNVLRDLYQEVIITKEVHAEFGGALPQWIVIVEVKNKEKQAEIESRLDKGEASSIALALETADATLIIDELKGRKIAQSLGVDIIGTIGVLVLADKMGLIKDTLAIILRMVNKGFRVSEVLLERLIVLYGKR